MSHNCHDEHASHDHDHGPNGHGGEHDHTDDVTPALQSYIYEEIDFDNITTLNESIPDSGQAIVKKSWQERMNADPELKSDADEQLLMYIPFAGQVKLHSILFRTSNSSSAPQTLRVYINRDDLDFAAASDVSPTQTLQLAQTSSIQEIPVKRALFNMTRSLTLFFEDNWSAGVEDETSIFYIGFKGDHTKLNKEPISVLYEAAANPSDHKTIVGVGKSVGSGIDGSGGPPHGL